MRRGKRDRAPSLLPALAWAAITFAMAGAAGAAGYLVAAATEDAAAESPADSFAPLAETPRLLQATEIYAAGRRAGARAARPRALAQGRRQGRVLGRGEAGRPYRPGEPAYRRIFETGRLAGSSEALGSFAFADDGFYIVGVSRGGRRLGISQGPLRPGDAYELCDAGSRPCVRRGRP